MKPCSHREQEKKLPCLERENISFGGAWATFNLGGLGHLFPGPGTKCNVGGTANGGGSELLPGSALGEREPRAVLL